MSHEPPQNSGDPGQQGNEGWSPRDPSTAKPTPKDPDAPDAAVAPDAAAQDTQEADGASEAEGRTKRSKRPRRTGWRRAVPTWRMTLGGVLFLALLLVGGFVVGYQLVDIPAANAAATAQSNVYLYADGKKVIARDGEINREKVPLRRVPVPVRHAVLAAEDRDFYSEDAIDVKATLRAGWKTVTGAGRQGGSTITQQYVKNYYLGQEQTVVRKAKEFFISVKLDREQSKDEILEGYLNTSYFGRNAYGIQAASHAYYDKDVEDLTPGEGAYLASLLNAPSNYDVVVHPENKKAALARWNYVLDGMVKEKWLSRSDRKAMTFPVPVKAESPTALSGQRGYIVQAVEAYLADNKVIDKKTLATGGYRIVTTLQKDKQDALVGAVEKNVLSKTSDDRDADRNVRAGGVSVDPADGHVVALYGGVDYTRQYVNNATRRDYQVGSTFKPFVLAAALANGSKTQGGRAITPNTRYDGTNERTVQGSTGSTDYSPANEDDVDYGSITVREATDKSVNAVYAQMAQDVGPERVKDTAVALGIPETTPDLSGTPSIALGPATASVLDMASAYATLADHGRQRPHSLVVKISKDGNDLRLPTRKSRQAISRKAADTTTSVLLSVVEGGTATAARSAGRPAAGKTGTAEEDRAAWFAGYTPDLATVIAVMGQDPETGIQKPLYGALGLPRMNGGGAPAETWGAYTRAALKGSDAEDFDLEADEGPEEEEGDEDTEESGPSKRPGDTREAEGRGTASPTAKAPGDRTGTKPSGTPAPAVPGRTPRAEPPAGGAGASPAPPAGDARPKTAASPPSDTPAP
ncbi:transglycosylase domain-containing protein [Streptomyces sp. NBC_01754]|uniref:transglycosylase domain-containing protein n=1 Tax=Streptomyces sp. NBC_01754 TaxID=2975930 RepID=UPI002DDB6010|nr:transglycosylase domain-containing protein [Streptomyces sp. NBC_01754]WSC92678.1 transglycosylase domain-containing protein [Streptomyces sp. NBC_01754]